MVRERVYKYEREREENLEQRKWDKRRKRRGKEDIGVR